MGYKHSVVHLLALSPREPYLKVYMLSVLQSPRSDKVAFLGHGIGRADASATDAMLLPVLQDAFSRLTSRFFILL